MRRQPWKSKHFELIPPPYPNPNPRGAENGTCRRKRREIVDPALGGDRWEDNYGRANFSSWFHFQIRFQDHMHLDVENVNENGEKSSIQPPEVTEEKTTLEEQTFWVDFTSEFASRSAWIWKWSGLKVIWIWKWNLLTKTARNRRNSSRRWQNGKTIPESGYLRNSAKAF